MSIVTIQTKLTEEATSDDKEYIHEHIQRLLNDIDVDAKISEITIKVKHTDYIVPQKITSSIKCKSLV